MPTLPRESEYIRKREETYLAPILAVAWVRFDRDASSNLCYSHQQRKKVCAIYVTYKERLSMIIIAQRALIELDISFTRTRIQTFLFSDVIEIVDYEELIWRMSEYKLRKNELNPRSLSVRALHI